MKKKIAMILFAIFLFVFIVTSVISIKNRILSSILKDEELEIFIPTSISDYYTDNMKFGFDGQKIWRYDLNNEDTVKIEEEIYSFPWKLVKEEENYKLNFYFGKSKPENLSETIYYCLYDLRLQEFIDFNYGDLLGWSRLLFLYDCETHSYYCIYMDI